MQIGTLIYCFPVQGDRCKSRDNRRGRGGGGGRNDSWGWLSSAVSPPRVRATEGDQDGQPNQGSPLGPETLQGRPKGGSAEIKKKPTKQTLYADREDPAGSVVSCPTPWAGSRADGRGYMTLPLGNPHGLWGGQKLFSDTPTFQAWEGLWWM